MVKNLLKRWPIRPITVFVDITDIDCAEKKVHITYFKVTKIGLLYYRRVDLET